MAGRPSANAAHEKRLHLPPLHGETRRRVHYLPHQMRDHLLADGAILLARQFCHGPCDRAHQPYPGRTASAGVELSLRPVAVSASRENRLRRSPLHGETRRHSALSAASIAR